MHRTHGTSRASLEASSAVALASRPSLPGEVASPSTLVRDSKTLSNGDQLQEGNLMHHAAGKSKGIPAALPLWCRGSCSDIPIVARASSGLQRLANQACLPHCPECRLGLIAQACCCAGGCHRPCASKPVPVSRRHSEAPPLHRGERRCVCLCSRISTDGGCIWPGAGAALVLHSIRISVHKAGMDQRRTSWTETRSLCALPGSVPSGRMRVPASGMCAHQRCRLELARATRKRRSRQAARVG